MKSLFPLLFLLSVSTLGAQDLESKHIIPFLCDNDKYGIADLTSETHSPCIFDELNTSTIGVTLGQIEGQSVFVQKNGTYSPPISGLPYSSARILAPYDRLISDQRFFSFNENGATYIYDVILNEHYGPLTQSDKMPSSFAALSYDFYPSVTTYVYFSKGESQLVLSTTGATRLLPTKKTSSFTIKEGYLFVSGTEGNPSIVYDENLNVQLEADTIIFPNRHYEYIIAQKDKKRFKVIPLKTFDLNTSDSQSTLSLEEIPLSQRWTFGGYTYHETEKKRWLEDKEGKLFHTFDNKDIVRPYGSNLLVHNNGRKKLLLGDPSLKLRQPFISLTKIGKNKNKYLFQDSSGYYILNQKGTLDSDQVFKKAHTVDNTLLWTLSSKNKGALLDENMNVILETPEEIVRTFRGKTYVYKADSLYGLLDSTGHRLTPPLSTQSDFYTTPELGWIKIDQGKKAYVYNIYTKARTEGLSNEFNFGDRYKDEEGNPMISSFSYGVDSAYVYRQDGSLYASFSRKEFSSFQRKKGRYNRKEITRDNYIFIDLLYTDTLLVCNDCEGMYMIDLDFENKLDFVICSYRKSHQDLYDKKGNRLLPEGMSMLSRASHHNELKFYPRIIVQQDGKIGIYDIEEKKVIIPIVYDNVERMNDTYLSIRTKGKHQITDLNGKPINKEYYYRTFPIDNGDIAAQFPMEGTHKKKVHFDENDPYMDPCEGKIIDAPNYYYKIIDKNGKSRFSKMFIKYSYRSDDLINVMEWTGKDTLYYCMNLDGKKRLSTTEEVIYKPFHKDINERRENRKHMFVDKNLKPKVDRSFDQINYHEVEDITTFYHGNDSVYTYVYNEKFEETARVNGNYFLSRYGTTMLYLYHHDHEDIYLLNIDGTPFTSEILKKAAYHNQHGVMKYKKGDKLVYVDMLNGRKFWE